MTGSIDVGSWGNGPFAVIYEDGTRFENVTVRHSIFTPGELCVLGNWEFTEPLDLDRAVAVEIWSQILSGCPSVTDSEVKSLFSIFLSFLCLWGEKNAPRSAERLVF